MGAFTTAVTNLISPPGGRRNANDLAAALAAFGRSGLCGGRLSKVSTNLSFGRVNGLYIPISGSLEEIPSTPVTLAATGATPDTTYNAYMFMSGGTMTMERSTTAWVLDTTWGYPVKSGDTSRTLVGIARAVTGPAWVDTSAFRGVASFWNPVVRPLFTLSTADRATSSTTLVELHTEMRAQWVQFAWEIVNLTVEGAFTVDDSGGITLLTLGFDAVGNATLLNAFTAPNTAWLGSLTASRTIDRTEGFHFATPCALVGAGTVVANYLSGRTGLNGGIYP